MLPPIRNLITPSGPCLAQDVRYLKFGSESFRSGAIARWWRGPGGLARLAAMVRLAWIGALLAAAAPGGASSAAVVIHASGHWAALDRGIACEAATRSLRIAGEGRAQARAGFAFDVAGPRNGQFYARLSREVRPGSSVMLTVGARPFMLVGRGGWAWSRSPAQDSAIIAAARAAGGMRIQARDRSGRRFTDRYLLDGAATAIDAAAARCAGKSAAR